tara:strand:+ start:3733 stop:4182 length:450 start_codon:yes stop_codon:yes gene_type:complete
MSREMFVKNRDALLRLVMGLTGGPGIEDPEVAEVFLELLLIQFPGDPWTTDWAPFLHSRSFNLSAYLDLVRTARRRVDMITHLGGIFRDHDRDTLRERADESPAELLAGWVAGELNCSPGDVFVKQTGPPMIVVVGEVTLRVDVTEVLS